MCSQRRGGTQRGWILTAVMFGTALNGLLVESALAGKPGGGGGPAPVVTRRYAFEIIPSLGGNRTSAQGINTFGDVVGLSRTPSGSGRAFVSFVEDGVRLTYDLNTLLHPDDGARWLLQTAYGINDAGQICGTGQFDGQSTSYRLTPDGFLDEFGQSWPSLESFPFGGGIGGLRINSDGDVAGQFGDVAAVYTASGQLVTLGFLYGADNYSEALDLNDSGQAVGFSGTNPGFFRAFRFEAGAGMIDLGYISADRGKVQAFAQAINNAGDVVGNCSAGKNKQHAFLYREGQPLKDLGELGGGYSEARDITESGEVVGVAWLSSGSMHPFLYTEQYKLVDLEPLIVNLPTLYRNRLGRNAHNGWTNTMQVNEAGQICGTAGDGSTVPLEAYLLTKIAD